MPGELTFLVPTKNRATLLGRCLDSALAQTMPVEIVVVDGGSTDETPEVCAEYRRRRSDIYVQRFERDPGYMTSWYIAAALAQTRVVHWALDDDWKDPRFAERTMTLLEDGVGFVFTQALVHYDDGTTRPNLSWDVAATQIMRSDAVLDFELQMSMTISPSCCIMRREDALDFLSPAQLPSTSRRMAANEIMMILGLMLRYPSVGYVPDPLAHFGAIETCSTIAAMKAGGERWQRFLADYREVKDAFLWLKSGMR